MGNRRAAAGKPEIMMEKPAAVHIKWHFLDFPDGFAFYGGTYKMAFLRKSWGIGGQENGISTYKRCQLYVPLL